MENVNRENAKNKGEKNNKKPTLNKSDLHVLMQVDFSYFNAKMGLTNLQQMQEKCESIYINYGTKYRRQRIAHISDGS